MDGYEGALIDKKFLPKKRRKFKQSPDQCVAITVYKPKSQHKKTYGEEIICRIVGYGCSDKAEAFKVQYLSIPENIKVKDEEACIVLSYEESMDDYLGIKEYKYYKPEEESFLYTGPFGYFQGGKHDE
jgi:hypothetical protein